jgi:hypothetical protein
MTRPSPHPPLLVLPGGPGRQSARPARTVGTTDKNAEAYPEIWALDT